MMTSEYLAIGFLFVMFWISGVIAIGSILVLCNKLAILGEEEDACAALLVYNRLLDARPM